MEARAIQIYKPVNKNEVRLVYRIKNSTVTGENGRHQKSYSFNKYGEENAWNMARDAFKFINSNNKLPFDFSDPWRAKLINKRGRKSLGYNNGSSLLDSQGSPITNKRLASLKSEFYGEDLAEGNVLGSRDGRNCSPPSISSVKYASLRDHYDIDSSASPASPQVSPNLMYKFEGKFSDLEMKNSLEDYHLPSSSYLHLLAAAATEIFEKQEIHVGGGENATRLEISSNLAREGGGFESHIRENSMSPGKVEDTGFAASFGLQAIQQNQNADLNLNQSLLPCALSALPEIPKIILNPERYYGLANVPLYNVPLYFNGQASGSQYASALINSANQHFMFIDPSLAYLPSNHR